MWCWNVGTSQNRSQIPGMFCYVVLENDGLGSWNDRVKYEVLHKGRGDRGSTVVKLLCYKSEGRWFDPSWCQWIFHWHKILSDIALWPWGRLSLLQKFVPGVFPRGKSGRGVRLTTYHHPVPLSRNLGALTSWNPLGLSRPVMGLLYLYLYIKSGWKRIFHIQ